MDQHIADCWQCTDCSAYFADEACTTPIASSDEAELLPATGHNFADGVCIYCGSTDWLYSPITSEQQLWAMGEDTTYILVADVNGTYYTMGMPPVEMNDSYPGIAYDLITVTPKTDGTISAEGLEAAQFQLIYSDYGYGIKLPNYWMMSMSGASEPWVEPAVYPTATLPDLTNTGGWTVEFYTNPDAAFTGGVTEMTYAEYLQSQNPALFDNLETGSVFIYNSYDANIASAMRLRDYTNPNGRQFYIAMGNTSAEEGAEDVQYPLYLYAAFDHAHTMSESVVGIDANTHGIVCTVEGCTYAENHEEHSLPETWTYLDETVHGKTCSVCGEQVTAQHRSVYQDNGDGTHSLSCAICNPVIEPLPHNWSEWAYNPNRSTHERFCMQCSAYETNDAHIWGNVEYTSIPTCEESGSVYAACSIPGCETVVDAELAATGHIWSSWYTTFEASEVDPGAQIRYCLNGCGMIEDRSLPRLGHVHQLTYVEPMSPHCYEQGMAAHYVCDFADTAGTDYGCGNLYLDAEGTRQTSYSDLLLMPAEHSFTNWYYPETSDRNPIPTETTSGFMVRECTICGETQELFLPHTNHQHQLKKVEATDPTCLLPGNMEYYVCSFEDQYDESGALLDSACGAKYSDEIYSVRLDSYGPDYELIPATGHTMGAWSSNEKVHERACSSCGYSEAVPHIYSEYADNAADETTCQLICLTCNYVFDCGEHSFGDYLPGNDGTQHHQTCGACGYVLTNEHSWSLWQPTDSGEHVRTCDLCGEAEYTTAHNWIAGENKWFDCTAGGIEAYVCTVDGCTATREVEIPAADHNWSVWSYLEEPTQLQGGTQFRYCLNGCDAMQTRDCPAYGHLHTLRKVEGQAATCWSEGTMAYYICNYTVNEGNGDEADYNDSCNCMFLDEAGLQQVTQDELVIPPTGEHSLGDWIMLAEQSPNLPEAVQYYRECSVDGCGYIEYRNEPKEDHTHQMTAVKAMEPSCASEGNIAYFFCSGCGCAYEDADGTTRLEEAELILPRLSHAFGEWSEAADFAGHTHSCELCGYTVSAAHINSPLPGTEESCAHFCRICGYEDNYGGHTFGDIQPCNDRWQHQSICQNCGYAAMENHTFDQWSYGSYQNASTGQMVLGHYRSCACGVQETSAAHIWDEGKETKPGHVTHYCIAYLGDGSAFDCGGVKEEFLRCMHACFTCGMCTADVTCPGKEPCTCQTPEALILQAPTVITNQIEYPEQSYLADILLKEEDAPLDPDAAPNQQIPEEYAGYTVGIQEIPLETDDGPSPLSNPYTEYVLQALDSYAPRYLFDIHLLDGNGMITETNGKAQYLIRLYLKPEIVMDLRNGLLRLAHITEDGTFFYGVGNDCIPFYVLEGTSAWFWADTFSPFALVESEVPYYGREALGKMANKDALLYAYDQLVAGVETSLEKIQIYPAGGTPEASIEEMKIVMDAYTRDHPEHFWLDGKYSISYKKDSGMASAIKPVYTMSGVDLQNARAAFDAKTNELLNGISADQSEFDRQVILHDRLAGIIAYDKTLSNAHIRDAYGGIVNGLSVCQGYAESLQYLLRQAGIQSFVVTGYSQNQLHAWNLVRIDGEYYHTDLTWNDQGEKLFHAYFNMNDDYITEDHAIYVTAYPVDSCEKMESNYFKMKHLDLTDAEAKTVSAVADKLKVNGTVASFLLTGNMSTAKFAEWFTDHKKELLRESGLTGAQVTGYSLLGRETMVFFSGIPAHTCSNGVLIAGKAATCTTPGWKDYYRCSCDKLYADADCSSPIANLSAWKTGAGKISATHRYGALVAAQPEQHTESILKAGIAAHYRCTICNGYFTESMEVTTLKALTGTVPAHSYGGWIATDASRHWKQCSCGLKTEESAHVYANEADPDCNTCGHMREIINLPPHGLSGAEVDAENGKITLTIASREASSGKIMVAVYGVSGRMLGIRYVDEIVNIDSFGKEYTVFYDKSGSPCQVKAFLVDAGFAPALAFAPLLLP